MAINAYNAKHYLHDWMCCGAKLFEVQNLHGMSNVTEMNRNNLGGGLLLYLYPRDNKCTLNDTAFMWLDKLPWRGFSIFLLLSSTASENIWCDWLFTAISVIFCVEYNTLHNLALSMLRTLWKSAIHYEGCDVLRCKPEVADVGCVSCH